MDNQFKENVIKSFGMVKADVITVQASLADISIALQETNKDLIKSVAAVKEEMRGEYGFVARKESKDIKNLKKQVKSLYSKNKKLTVALKNENKINSRILKQFKDLSKQIELLQVAHTALRIKLKKR